MIERVCNIWDMYNQDEVVCITTNGFVKKNYRAVMGRGVAAQAKEIVPDIDLMLGQSIMRIGHTVHLIAPRILSFPVKPICGQCHPNKRNVVPHMQHRFKDFDMVPGWAMMADMDIIEQSLRQLKWWFYDEGFFERVYLPKPGCGAGGLKWEDVKQSVELMSGDWLVVCDLK